MNDRANIAFTGQARDFGRLSLPTLFLHGPWDAICDSPDGRLADPMRTDCTDLTEAITAAGHTLMVEEPQALNEAIETWLRDKQLFPEGAER